MRKVSKSTKTIDVDEVCLLVDGNLSRENIFFDGADGHFEGFNARRHLTGYTPVCGGNGTEVGIFRHKMKNDVGFGDGQLVLKLRSNSLFESSTVGSKQKNQHSSLTDLEVESEPVLGESVPKRLDGKGNNINK